MAKNNGSVGLHDKLERNIWLLLFFTAIAVSVGGLVEIVPLFTMKSTMEHNKAPELVWQRKAGQTLHDHQPGDQVMTMDKEIKCQAMVCAHIRRWNWQAVTSINVKAAISVIRR